MLATYPGGDEQLEQLLKLSKRAQAAQGQRTGQLSGQQQGHHVGRARRRWAGPANWRTAWDRGQLQVTDFAAMPASDPAVDPVDELIDLAAMTRDLARRRLHRAADRGQRDPAGAQPAATGPDRTRPDRQPRRDRRPAPPRATPAPDHPVPRLRSLAAVLATYDGATELDEGLSIVLAGLCSQLHT